MDVDGKGQSRYPCKLKGHLIQSRRCNVVDIISARTGKNHGE